jgi:hypothetical protein
MKALFTLCFIFCCFFSFAAGETVVVVTNTGDGFAETPSELKPVNPCASLSFKVNINVPPDYIIVGKFEWFVNDILVKTTTDATDPILQWTIISKSTSVYCKVTYKKTDGSLSAPSTSTTFTPDIKDLNFNDISTSSPSPNYGCTTSTVNYVLNTFNCTGNFCDNTYPVSQYNITWQAPAGWTQTSISNNGSNVSFLPDASTAGPLVATITLPCGYTETKTFNTSRAAQAPNFTTSAFTTCTSSATVSISSVCGATNYTYTVSGNPGITFTSNGLQTLTTANTSVSLTISGGSSLNALKAKANYPNSISSTESEATLTAGSPAPGAITPVSIDPFIGRIQVQIDPIPGATNYDWFKNGILQSTYHSTFAQIPITKNLCDVSYSISVQAKTCNVNSALTYKDVYVPPCDNFYMVSPNPASNDITVSINESGTQSASNKTFDEVRIYDFQGNLKKYQPFNKSKAGNLNISGLPNGTYFIEIIDGSYKEKHQLIIQR